MPRHCARRRVQSATAALRRLLARSCGELARNDRVSVLTASIFTLNLDFSCHCEERLRDVAIRFLAMHSIALAAGR